MAEIILTNENFDSEINADIPVLVDFWATWCGPCLMLSPIISEIAEEYDGRVKVCKVNVDDEPELARKFGIMSIPTLLIFKNGTLCATSIGYKHKDEIVKLFKAV